MSEIAFTNINTLKEMGIHKTTPVLSASAEKMVIGTYYFKRDIVRCQQYKDCLDCPMYCPCNGITIAFEHKDDDEYHGGENK